MSDNYSVHMDLRPGAYPVAFVICLVITAAGVVVCGVLVVAAGKMCMKVRRCDNGRFI